MDTSDRAKRWKIVAARLLFWSPAAAGVLILGAIVILVRVDLTRELRRKRIHENTLKVEPALREIARAHWRYLQEAGDKAVDLPDLATMRRYCPEIPPGIVAADARGKKPVPYHGYLFHVVRPEVKGELLVCAFPEIYEVTGTQTFILVYGSWWGLLKNDTKGISVDQASCEELSLAGWAIAD
ncbi:MAG: hypothetical protein HYY17_05760 [Planctomycetes bacterium]|nr:hypothetical protein [Planctomycetota bacterium]